MLSQHIIFNNLLLCVCHIILLYTLQTSVTKSNNRKKSSFFQHLSSRRPIITLYYNKKDRNVPTYICILWTQLISWIFFIFFAFAMMFLQLRVDVHKRIFPFNTTTATKTKTDGPERNAMHHYCRSLSPMSLKFHWHSLHSHYTHSRNNAKNTLVSPNTTMNTYKLAETGMCSRGRPALYIWSTIVFLRKWV